MEWIPRSENYLAGYYSKKVEDLDDWGLSLRLFDMIISPFGPFSIDWFALVHNAKVVRFFSWCWNTASLGVDAFAVSWSFEYGLFVHLFPWL